MNKNILNGLLLIVISFFTGILYYKYNGPKVKEVIVEKEVPVEVIKEVEVPVIEYVPIEKIVKVENDEVEWIDPESIPVTYPKAYVRGMTVHEHLVNDHGVKPKQIRGWSIPDLNNLHTYLHNGGKL